MLFTKSLINEKREEKSFKRKVTFNSFLNLRFLLNSTLSTTCVSLLLKINLKGFEKTWVIAKKLGQLSALTQIIH